ncbi:hypothetical protein RRG08_061573 [Elysia crispata]|uniref:Uncharacterized protein n=1 Tax=Elysia crispata TaxID=231223 RepID=A0AAE0YSZ0_9GAST|nr:hypothetical protein RRG08_061573 [Elysia crispata]
MSFIKSFEDRLGTGHKAISGYRTSQSRVNIGAQTAWFECSKPVTAQRPPKWGSLDSLTFFLMLFPAICEAQQWVTGAWRDRHNKF